MLRKGFGQAVVGEGTADRGGPGSLCTQEASGIAVNRLPNLEATAGMPLQACCQELHNTVTDRIRKANCPLQGQGNRAASAWLDYI